MKTKMSIFRAEHVGSFLRPYTLMEALNSYREGKLDAGGFEAAQNEAISSVVQMQESLGLKSITDGEFRRRGWSAGFIDSIDGFGLREGAIGFKKEGIEQVAELSPYAAKKLSRRGSIVVNDFRFLKSSVRLGRPKVTIASPSVMHYFLGPRSFNQKVYRDKDNYFEDLIRIYREEIQDLAKEGCEFLQLDDTALPCNCDPRFRSEVSSRGENPDQLTEFYSEVINRIVAGRPKSMKVAIHMCRGNLKGTWMADGGYEPIAEKLFHNTNIDGWFLEYDTNRAGDFSPLKYMPENKFVVLGLLSTKTPKLENKDEIKRRIEDAEQFIPIENLCISPQCGFSSAPGRGQVLTFDDQIRKLTLLLEIAEEIWKDT